MDESREKRRNSFLDLWTRKKQNSPSGLTGPNGRVPQRYPPRYNEREIQDSRHPKGSPKVSSSSSSSSSSFQSSDSDSQDTSPMSEMRQYRHHHHRDRLEQHHLTQDHHFPVQSPRRDDISKRLNYDTQEYSIQSSERNSYATQYDFSHNKYSREHLFALTPGKLRDLCLTLGLDYRLNQKSDLVEAIHNHLHSRYNNNSGSKNRNNVQEDNTLHTTPSKASSYLLENTRGTPDDYNQMTLLLQEIIPFYGQGDGKTDSVVRQTIAKLPKMYLDMQDSRFGNTILMLCIQHGILDLVPLLLQKGCDPNIPNYDGSIGLHFLCDPESFELAQALIACGANVNIAEHKYGCTPLHWAASSANTALCKSLCNAGANPTARDFNGYDSLAYAKQSANSECLSYLMHVVQSYSVDTPFPGYYDQPWRGVHNQTVTNVHEASATILPPVEVRQLNSVVSSSIQPSGKSSDEQVEVSMTTIDGASKTIPNERPEDNCLHINKALETELLQHLLSIENKLNSKGDTNSIDAFQKEREHISEMSNKLLQAQADLASKQMELMTVGFEMASLREKYDSLVSKSRPLADVGEKNFGDSILCPDEDITTEDQCETRPLEICEPFIHQNDNTAEGIEHIVAETNCDMKDEIIALQRKVQILELENGRLFGKKLEQETQLNTLQDQLTSQTQTFFEAIKSKDIEIETMKHTMFQLMDKDGTCKNDNSAREALEQLKLTSEQISEQLARSTAENESLRSFYELEITRLKSDIESSSIIMKDLQDKYDTNERKLSDLVHALSLEKESNKELSVHNARILEEVTNEKDVLINKWRREYVILEDLHEIAKRDLELCRKKNVEVDIKLQEMSALLNEAKVALAANEKLHRMLQSETDKRKALHNQLEDMKGRIRVYVRIRPISSEEIEKGFKCAVFKDDSKVAIIHSDDHGNDPRYWEFDCVFGGKAEEGNNQVNVFKDTSNLITSVVDGYNVCIVAYGQTGSGKTYTMVGSGDSTVPLKRDGYLDADTGLASRSSIELFRLLDEKEASHVFNVDVIVLELYMDGLKDLLASGKGQITETLRIKLAEHSESGLVEVDGATKQRATNAVDLISILRKGTAFRSTASTQMNSDSSRSHLITIIEISLTHKKTGKVTRGKLTLVDLAGSERVNKSGATGIQLKEAQSINKSLSALGDVVNALTSGSKHIPYRNHPLTMLMSDSIGGNSKTLMFICCSPVEYNISETVSSLEFAKRCKDVTNSVLNPSSQLRQIKHLRSEIERLRHEKGQNMRRLPAHVDDIPISSSSQAPCAFNTVARFVQFNYCESNPRLTVKVLDLD